MFTKPAADVRIEDVERFCREESIAEGVVVEYKSDFPKNLEKSISSFANTYGGLLIIGVGANKTTNKPNWPTQGIELDEGLEERVTGISLRSITPPVVPDVAVIPLSSEKERCVVIVRVHESPHSPHAIDNNRRVYVRVNSQNEPILADQNRIQWLTDRRREAENFKLTLKKRVRSRFGRHYLPELGKLCEFSFLPRFPTEAIVSRRLLAQVVAGLETSHIESFRFGTHYSLVSLTDGVGAWPQTDRDGEEIGHPEHWEFSSFGGVHLLYQWPQGKGGADEHRAVFDLRHWSFRFEGYLRTVRDWLLGISWLGVADIELRIQGVFDSAVYWPRANDMFPDSRRPEGICSEESVSVSSTLTWTGSGPELAGSIQELARQVYWGLGCITPGRKEPPWIEKRSEDISKAFEA